MKQIKLYNNSLCIQIQHECTFFSLFDDQFCSQLFLLNEIFPSIDVLTTLITPSVFLAEWLGLLSLPLHFSTARLTDD